jgi:short-subunit dehydrogenase
MTDRAAGSPRKVAIITGASDGIGAEFARVFATKGHDLALVARRRDRLEELADEIAATGARRPIVIELDLLAEGAAASLERALAAVGAEPEILVNNAGFGLMGRVLELDSAEQLAIVDLNVRALTALTLHFLKPIVAAKGAILNVASLAAFMPGPGFAIYYATKAYVLSFSEGLSEELRPLGVKVLALCPGPVATGFQNRAGFSYTGAMSVMKPALVGADEVARQAYDALFANKRVIVPGLLNKITIWATRFTPRFVLLPLLAQAQQARR